ncbi:zinc finger BED domain-containing protein RICESLEEPER 2-like [Senna tora]|uniref:Zinc finger BED domain-containing protein RICESLEEPER 2-like n=1 Tax=Senna tora TaxID=362788 RepID=A0A835C7P5_9FABA|nr:zinc finger BED domain-containing protein RICESLEEPER 2-like [Senna tora]
MGSNSPVHGSSSPSPITSNSPLQGSSSPSPIVTTSPPSPDHVCSMSAEFHLSQLIQIEDANVGQKRKTSVVWNHFKKLKVNGDDKSECNYCKKRLIAKSNDGTNICISTLALVHGIMGVAIVLDPSLTREAPKENVKDVGSNTDGPTLIDATYDILKRYDSFVEETEDTMTTAEHGGGIKYPILQKMVRDILAIPISTVASESAFSTGGRLVSPHRSKLKEDTLEAFMCSQNWIYLCGIALQDALKSKCFKTYEYDYDVEESEVDNPSLTS